MPLMLYPIDILLRQNALGYWVHNYLPLFQNIAPTTTLHDPLLILYYTIMSKNLILSPLLHVYILLKDDEEELGN